eukprot:COSAG02_NODE_22382_length_754_cov_1.496183_1_plen_48_part_10
MIYRAAASATDATRARALARVPVKTPMTEGRTKHSAQIKIDLLVFPQM